MSKILNYMNKQMTEMRQALEQFNIPIFEDEIAEDEEEQLYQNGYNCFVFETLGMSNNRDLKSITQQVVIYYYSENRDDLDEQTADIILALKNVTGFTFERTTKQRLQKKDTDQFVDRIIFTYNRKLPIGV